MSMYDGCFDYNNPPPIDWDHLPPFVQNGEEEIKGWSLPLEAWDSDCRVWYWTEKSGRHGDALGLARGIFVRRHRHAQAPVAQARRGLHAPDAAVEQALLAIVLEADELVAGLRRRA